MSTNHNLSEEKGEPKRYRTEVLPLTSLTPYRWAKPAHQDQFGRWSLGETCLTPRCLRRGTGGDRDPRKWESRRLYLSLHCHHQNDSCIQMGSDVSHFNVSLTVRNKVTRQCPQTTTFINGKGRAEAESNLGPSAYQPNA